jgi:hypothetical protein
MKKILIILFINLNNVYAENIPLPPSVAGIDDIINDFRGTLTTKIIDLGKNFIGQLSDKTIIFKHNNVLNCHGDMIPQGEPVSSLQYNYKKTNNELVEKSIYTGCLGQISLVEDVVTRGGELAPLKYSDFIKGKRNIDLDDQQNYRLYRISNSNNEEIFKMLIEKSDQKKLVDFYILGQRFLRFNYNFTESETRLTITYTGYSAKYVQKYGSWEIDSNFDPINNAVIVTKGGINQVKYIDGNGSAISQNDFLSRFDKFVTSGSIARVRSIFNYHNFYFPTTKIIQTGTQNEHLKAELRVAFNRLQNNIELNLVKKQIQEYIDAVENGLIIDNRPKQ